jgi:hypothetical protein
MASGPHTHPVNPLIVTRTRPGPPVSHPCVPSPIPHSGTAPCLVRARARWESWAAVFPHPLARAPAGYHPRLSVRPLLGRPAAHHVPYSAAALRSIGHRHGDVRTPARTTASGQNPPRPPQPTRSLSCSTTHRTPHLARSRATSHMRWCRRPPGRSDR